LRIIRELLTIEPSLGSGTDIGACLQFFNNASRRRTIAFLLSDFFSKPYQEPLKLTARKHDLIGIQVFDPVDESIPDIGMTHVRDSESGQQHWLDTGSIAVRRYYHQIFEQHQQYCKDTFRKSGASVVSIRTDEDYVKKLKGFFMGR
jgi:hypothetical protein